MTCGIPQEFVLGKILFIVYAAGLLHLITRHNLGAHQYADDTQAQAETASLADRIAVCLDDLA
jgi:hypothetical protein